MARDLSPNQRKFGRTILTAAGLLVAAAIIYGVGGQGETSTLISTVLNVLGTITAVVAVALRWKGPWRDAGTSE